MLGDDPELFYGAWLALNTPLRPSDMHDLYLHTFIELKDALT